MRLFWRKNRGPADNPRDHHDVTACFPDADWDRIDDFLSRQKPGDCTSYLKHSRNVMSSLAELRASIGQQIVPSAAVLDRLLDVWALVHQVDPHAARPAESLLSSLVTRDLVSAKEVTDTCDEIEAALEAQRGRALEDAPGQIAHQVPGKTN